MNTVIKRQNNLKSGQVMILTAIFFVVFTSGICLGLIDPVVEQIKNSNYYWNLNESYYLVEAGVEDVAYRFKGNVNMNGEETTLINQSGIVTDISEQDGNGITVSALGDERVRTELKKGIDEQPFEILNWREI
ncbi:MAG: hypothetical protein WC229_02995 [Candidatus Paceibacterota bacterium]|jgi:hypothetical protein